MIGVRMQENMDTIFTALVEELGNCSSPHTALVHFTGLRSLRMLLSTCTGKGGWRQAFCELNVHEMPGAGKRGFEASKDLCGAIRGPPHQLLRIVCSKTAVSHNSAQTVARIRADSKRSLSDLLEERAQHQMSTQVAPFFSKKKKRVVAVILAQFLVKLVGCRWLQNDWNAETIFFLPDPSSGYEPDLQTPYILASLRPDRISDRTIDTLEYYSSFVFAFGLLLLELELDQSISITALDEMDAEEDYPAAYMALIRMFKYRKEDLDDPYIIQIIESCLDFRNRVESVQHPSFDEDLKFRAAISKYILTPLIQRLQVAHPDVPLDEILDKPKATVVRRSSQRLRGHGELFSGYTKRQPMSEHHAVQPPLSRTATGSTFAAHSSNRNSCPSGQRPKSRRDFKIAIICALPLEADAVKATFDKRWDGHEDVYGKASSDQNAYSTGIIERHNVVLAHMPGMGKESAARVAANCRFSFEGIKLALVVGICGGVPSSTNDEEILLGDVVISEGLVCYDFGRQLPGRFVRNDGVLDNYPRPPPEIRSLLNKLKGRWDRNLLQEKTFAYLTNVQDELGHSAKYPGSECDKLFDASYRHRHQQPSACGTCSESQPSNDSVCAKALASTCEDLGCDDSRLVQRERLSQPPPPGQSNKNVPMVHIGMVASGSTVMKSGLDRDRIANEEEVIAFEMEGAGVWDTFTCVIIKGVCDYADSHKSKKWQGYAAATAAACTKAFLEHWTSTL
ncbi:hypothetical protein LTR41_004558 [Exophiala xenobiotica]|nr:hypothetical protein LTR41_004558 [Exophiala xenobiotica]KAK5253799.1 hypothetical protein LTS06_001928 [Exophiala xenobiotica]KAK5424687.1 hypothetical protein LTR90_000277 [Exophiala xenobiotica]KAK5443853.1 hypothetical protein LTR18_005114 [Exophiala xenobiotica]KAK5500585.1 hypothetical protein LTR26_000276 [Exophiala xenobiotica]